MPPGKHSNWTHLCVFLGLDIGFDARRRSAGHAALVDGVLADWGRERKTQFRTFSEEKIEHRGGRKKQDFHAVMSETHEGSSYASANAVWKVSGANTRVRVWCKTSIREKHKLFLQKNIKYSFFLACCGATWFPSFSLFFRFQHQRSDVLTVSLMSGGESEKQ